MSDAVQVALIMAGGPLIAIILNHIFGQRDRALASKVVEQKNAEIEEQRMTYTSRIHALEGALAVCQANLQSCMDRNP